jgi:hypothetical protein
LVFDEEFECGVSFGRRLIVDAPGKTKEDF